MIERTKECLEPLIRECKNITEFCRKLGMVPKGHNYYVAKRLIDDFKLDVSHFCRTPWNKGIKYKTKVNRIRTMEEVLKEDSHISSNDLKKRLFNNGYKEKKCECCGNTEWFGLPMKLELHHINGNHFDNRIENLQILCPNCHSITDTYRGKNQHRYSQDVDALCKPLTKEEIITRNVDKKVKRNQNKRLAKEVRSCLYCGEAFSVKPSSKQKYCSNECARRGSSSKPSKEILEKDIQEIGYNLTQIGKKYGVSYGAVKKWVKSYGLYKRMGYQTNLGTRIGKYTLNGEESTVYTSLTKLMSQTHHKFNLAKLKEIDGVEYEGFIYKVVK